MNGASALVLAKFQTDQLLKTVERRLQTNQQIYPLYDN
jgi:hypothetical protein